jgi:hypothetical protein
MKMAIGGAQSTTGMITITTTITIIITKSFKFLRGTNEGRNHAKVAPLGVCPCTLAAFHSAQPLPPARVSSV